MVSAKVYSGDGQEIGTEELPETFFGIEPNEHLIYEAVKMYRARMRRGTHSTKNRSAVSGGGAKPWRQKGTGRARQGTIRAPQWVGGGRAFGPSPRDYSFSIPVKMRRKAFCSILSIKAKENNVVIIDDLKIDRPKTKIIASLIEKMKLNERKCLVLTDKMDENLRLASRNLSNLTTRAAELFNTWDVISNDVLIFTRAGLEKLKERKV